LLLDCGGQNGGGDNFWSDKTIAVGRQSLAENQKLH
jgi:hypothetical protein